MSDDLDKKSIILCFEHCGHKVFSLDVLPERCPRCLTDLSQCRLTLPPFKLPSPLSRAQDHPCSVVIKPTVGDFLRGYRGGDDLHIAATNSKGFVVEYDRSGVHRDRTMSWNGGCLVVDFGSVAAASDPDWGEYWDGCLEEVMRDWSDGDGYDENDHNCFAFVLTFLRALRQNPYSGAVCREKVQFCERYVVPRARAAGKYVTLFRKIVASDDGCVALEMKKVGSDAAADF